MTKFTARLLAVLSTFSLTADLAGAVALPPRNSRTSVAPIFTTQALAEPCAGMAGEAAVHVDRSIDRRRFLAGTTWLAALGARIGWGQDRSRWDAFSGDRHRAGQAITPWTEPYLQVRDYRSLNNVYDLSGKRLGTSRAALRMVGLSDDSTLGFLDSSDWGAIAESIEGTAYVLDPAGRILTTLSGPDREPIGKGQIVPIYYYERPRSRGLPATRRVAGHIRRTSDTGGVLLNISQEPVARLESVRQFYFERPGGELERRWGPPLAENERLISAPATRANEKALAEMIARLPPSSDRDDLGRKFELIHRRLEMQVQLGLRRAPTVDAASARRLLPNLMALRPDKFTAGSVLQSEVEAWGACMAQIDFWHALAWEAVQQFPPLQRQVVLETLLHSLESGLNNVRRPEMSVDVLKSQVWIASEFHRWWIDTLRFNSLTTREDIIQFFRELPIVEDPSLDDPWAASHAINRWDGINSFLQVRARLRASPATLAMLKALALQRAGYATKVLLPPEEYREVHLPADPLAKTRIRTTAQPVIFFVNAMRREDQTYILWPDDRIRPLGRFIGNQLSTFVEADIPEVDAAFAGWSRYDGDNLGWDHRTWFRNYAESLTLRRAADPIDTGRAMAAWYGQYESSMGNTMELARLRGQAQGKYFGRLAAEFDDMVFHYRLRVQMDETPSDDLLRAKALFATVCQALPEKFKRSITGIRLTTSIVAFEHAEFELENGRFVENNAVHAYDGSYHPSTAEIEVGRAHRPRAKSVATHELAHEWGALYLSGVTRLPFAQQRVRMELAKIFARISWSEDGTQWKIRRDPNLDTKLPEFRGSRHSLLNPGEDLSERFDEVVNEAAAFRRDIRAAVNLDTLRLAAKYLFVKYVMLVDDDGLALEHAITETDQPLTFQSVRNQFDSLLRNSGSQAEAIRLFGIMAQIEESNRRMRTEGPIVHRRSPDHPGKIYVASLRSA